MKVTITYDNGFSGTYEMPGSTPIKSLIQSARYYNVFGAKKATIKIGNGNAISKQFAL